MAMHFWLGRLQHRVVVFSGPELPTSAEVSQTLQHHDAKHYTWRPWPSMRSPYLLLPLSLLSLPNEILLNIILHLPRDPKSILACMSTCRQFHDLINGSRSSITTSRLANQHYPLSVTVTPNGQRGPPWQGHPGFELLGSLHRHATQMESLLAQFYSRNFEKYPFRNTETLEITNHQHHRRLLLAFFMVTITLVNCGSSSARSHFIFQGGFPPVLGALLPRLAVFCEIIADRCILPRIRQVPPSLESQTSPPFPAILLLECCLQHGPSVLADMMSMTDQWSTYDEFKLEFIRYFTKTPYGLNESLMHALFHADEGESDVAWYASSLCDIIPEVSDEYEAMGGDDGILMDEWVRRFPNDKALFKYWYIDSFGKPYCRSMIEPWDSGEDEYEQYEAIAH